MPDEEVVQEQQQADQQEKINYVSIYNKLVAEAVLLGLTTYKPMQSHFRDKKTGAARCAALESSIRAHKRGQDAADRQDGGEGPPEPAHQAPSQPEEGNDEMRSNVKRNKKRAAAKKVSKGKTDTRRKVTGKTKPVVRDGIAGVFETRPNTNKDKLLDILGKKNLGKPVSVDSLSKAIYGDVEKRGALKMVVLGLRVAITEKDLPYKIESEGEGKEATITLSKSK